jgi:hypothetical protein
MINAIWRPSVMCSCLSSIQFFIPLATLQVLSSHIWPIAVELDRADIEQFLPESESTFWWLIQEGRDGGLQVPTTFVCLYEPEIKPQVHGYKEKQASW